MKADEIAAAVVSVVSGALAPFRERIAAVEAHIKGLGDVRDRVVVLETKAAIPVPAPPIPEPVDFGPVLARIQDVEKGLGVFLELRDRVTVIETKAAIPPVVPELPEIPEPVDLDPVLERLAALEGQLKAIGDVRDRVISLEAKAAIPSPVPEIPEPVDIAPLATRIGALELKAAEVVPPDSGTAAALVNMTQELAVIRERLAVVESRAPVPGPPGPAGRDGLDGKDGIGLIGKDGAPGRDGKDGKDGEPGPAGVVKLEGMKWIQEDERTLVAKSADGAELGTAVLSYPLYRGVYIDGKAYEPGDEVTWGGSVWHANKSTVNERPGEGSRSWTLKVKRGRDGKDGLNGKDASLPVVKAQ